MDVYQPPQSPLQNVVPTIFLAGSIEMGTASLWQERVVSGLSDYHGILLNPRRNEWNPSWKQDRNNPLFQEQVNWELDGIEQSNLIVVHFEPKTKSPITLLELGFAIGSKKKIFISCPDGFWRKGNVEIIALRNNVSMYPSLETLIGALKTYLAPYRKESS